MVKLRLPEILHADDGIVRPAFSGYLIWAMLVLTGLALLILVTKNPVIFSTMQVIIIYSAMALSYDYFSGYSGYYNLGFGAFTGLGAYIFIFVTNAYGMGTVPVLNDVAIIFGFLVTGSLTALFAAGISYPFLRLRGAYFAIATLALIFLLPIIFQNFATYTGGLDGIHVGIAVPSIQNAFYVGSLIFLILAAAIHNYIGKTRLNLALKSIREEEEITESFGVNTFRVKQLGLALSGFFGGICGALYAIDIVFLNTQTAFSPVIGLTPVVASMTGGSGIFLGPIVGSFILGIVNQYFAVNSLFTLSPIVITGALLIIVGLFIPGGVLRIRSLRNIAYKHPDERIIRIFRKKQTRLTHTAIASENSATATASKMSS